MPQSANGSYTNKTVTTSAQSLASARATRESVAIQNVHATNILYVGFDSSVTASNGFKLTSGQSIAFDGYQGAVYGIADAASTDVRVLEVY